MPADARRVADDGRPAVPLVLALWVRTMSGVTQTILAGREDGVPGNCVQAAVASLLDLPLEAVPHFTLFEHWWNRLDEWLTGRGYVLKSRWVTEIPTERCIVAGTSPRGVAHVCIAEGGAIVWDPHPTRDGLADVTEAWFLDRAGAA